MPFYLIEQKGVPGKRLVEAGKPATALEHVIGDSFTVTKVDGRALLDAAKECEVEVAGAPDPEPEADVNEEKIVQSDAPANSRTNEPLTSEEAGEDEFGPRD